MPNNSTIHIWLHIKDNARTHARAHTLYLASFPVKTPTPTSPFLPLLPSSIPPLCVFMCVVTYKGSVWLQTKSVFQGSWTGHTL